MQEHIIDSWGLEQEDNGVINRLCELIAVYSVDGGCPGDHLTPPDPAYVTISDFYIKIFERGIGTIKAPAPDTLVDALDIRQLERDIEEELESLC